MKRFMSVTISAFVFSALAISAPSPQAPKIKAGTGLRAAKKAAPQSASGSYKNGPRFACLVTGEEEQIPPVLVGDASINGNHVFLNDRIGPDDVVFWRIPDHKVLIITDIVVQNRAPGDEPVDPLAFTGLGITAPSSGQDPFALTTVGNQTLNLHFETGLVEAHNGAFPHYIRFYNFGNSSAPFIEFVVTGVLADCHD